MSTLNFSKIVVLESLPDVEKRTGRLIFQDLEIITIPLDVDITVEYQAFESKHEMDAILTQLSHEAITYNDYPILHIEAHGSDDKKSLVLNSGEFVDWFELENSFRTLNLATKGNLLIVMATCFGAYVNSVVSLLDRAPFWGVIGPEHEVYPDEIFSGLTKFYSSIFAKRTGGDLYQTLNSTKLKLITAEWLFVKAYKYYVDKHCDSKILRKRADDLLRKYETYSIKYPPSIEMVEHFLNLKGEKNFDRLLSNFFMVDLYPQNTNKISVSYEKIGL